MRNPPPAADRPPAGHDPSDPQSWDLNGAVFDGGPQKLIGVLFECIRRSGARSIEFGYEPNPLTGETPEPGQPCRWFCEVVMPGGRIVRTHADSNPEHGHSSVVAGIEAAANMVRALGGRVTLEVKR